MLRPVIEADEASRTEPRFASLLPSAPTHHAALRLWCQPFRTCQPHFATGS